MPLPVVDYLKLPEDGDPYLEDEAVVVHVGAFGG